MFAGRKSLVRCFGIPTTSKSIIAPSKGVLPLLTRAELLQRIENPKFAENKELAEWEEKQKKIADFHMNLVNNDSNPQNFLGTRLKFITPSNQTASQIALAVPQFNEVPDILVVRREVKPPSVLARLGRCRGSVKKISPVVRLIRGLHVNEALEVMKDHHTYAATRVFSCLTTAKATALIKGMSELRLYVQSAITNKARRTIGVRYHARMKRGKEKRDWSSLLIRLEERPAREFFKDIVAGKTTPGVVKLWKQRILKSQDQFKLIQKYQFILTSKGRHQRREMIRRRAYSLQQQLAVNGWFNPRRKDAAFRSSTWNRKSWRRRP
jgi:ribosomal protein L22